LTYSINLKIGLPTQTTLYPIRRSSEWLSVVRSKDLYLGFGLFILEGCFTEVRVM